MHDCACVAKHRLGPALMALDRHNLTGSFSMDLNSSMHRAVAWRLQLAALQDNATSECRCGAGALRRLRTTV